ncbi:MAG: hypothetical protein AAGB31_05490 [Bdellovibrio sp.]
MINPFLSVKNERGESLITVLVAVGIMAIIMAGSTLMFSHMMKSQKTVTVKNAMESLIVETKMALGSGQTCKLNLQNLVLPAIGSESVTSLTESLRYATADGSALSSNTFLPLNTMKDGFRVISANLGESQFSGSEVIIGQLHLTMQSEGLLGGDTFVRSIPIQFKVNGSNQILDCSSANGMISGNGGAGDGSCPAGTYYFSGAGSGCGSGAVTVVLKSSPNGIYLARKVTVTENGFPTETRMMKVVEPNGWTSELFFTCANKAWQNTFTLDSCVGGDGW